MFWKKSNTEKRSQSNVKKLPGPRSIEELVGRRLVVDLKLSPDWVWQLKSVVRRRLDGKQRFDFRVFETAQALAEKLKIKDYNSFDSHLGLVLYQGWFDKASQEVHFEKKETAQP